MRLINDFQEAEAQREFTLKEKERVEQDKGLKAKELELKRKMYTEKNERARAEFDKVKKAAMLSIFLEIDKDRELDVDSIYEALQEELRLTLI